ncbi:MAG: prepilin-type N-terminal cleavage/methylation domain-containing protein [Gallionella sp.]|nr:prepilin-type N-terminal cleavage/methylation domain-containing protein [Gallionella sp.]
MRTTAQRGFTLVEMIMVIVITGIIGGIVAVFLKAPVQQYMDVARRAELTDIADTAVRRMARDIRTAVPNSVRVPNPTSTSTYIEFMPTRDGGRYRANSTGGGVGCGTVADSVLDFAAADTCFEIIGSAIKFNSINDQIVVGSTQSDGAPPYQLPTSATGIRRAIDAAGVGTFQYVKITSTTALPAWAELSSQRFDVVDGAQQAVTYACVPTVGTVAADDGTLSLMRYWNYGFHSMQQTPAGIAANTAPVAAHSEAILAHKASACEITYDVPNQRFGLVTVRLTLTSGGESVSLYNEIHVNNAP